MTPVYINHELPQVKAIDAAHEILRNARKALFQDGYRLPRVADRNKARKAFAVVDNASIHLSEEIRNTPEWWRE